MSKIDIPQTLDVFRQLAYQHLKQGTLEGLVALKQTLEMDNETFANLIEPLLVDNPIELVTPQESTVKPTIERVKAVKPIRESQSAAKLEELKNEPSSRRYLVRLSVSPTNFISCVLENTETGIIDYKGHFGQLFTNHLKPGDIIELKTIPQNGLNDDLDYEKVDFDEDVANQYPYVEDLPVGYLSATNRYYINVPAQEHTKAFRYYISPEMVDKLDERLGYASFREGCLVSGFALSETRFHITYAKPRPFSSVVISPSK